MWTVVTNGTETEIFRQSETNAIMMIWDDASLVPSPLFPDSMEGERYFCEVEYCKDLPQKVLANKQEWIEKGRLFEAEQLSKWDAEQKAREIIQQAQLISIINTLQDDEIKLIAPICDEWAPGVTYKKNFPLMWNQQVYLVLQEHISQDHQQPDSPGMLSIYRPVHNDHSGTIADPIPWVYGMDCLSGKYYQFNNQIYLCLGDMIPCVWEPGASGVHQWGSPIDTE